jgi:hypothetical protein
MASTLHQHQTSVFSGLGTSTFTIPAAGLYNMSAQAIQVPAVGMIITINQNGSPIATSSAFTGAQEILNAFAQVVCALNDVITIVVSSSSPTDISLIQVKNTHSINRVM